ncbi:MAG: hypothetical protein HC875_10445 [Anaerolineales bacterium]|nr:hypothetical protein [Anaerolineales bacterium]
MIRPIRCVMGLCCAEDAEPGHLVERPFTAMGVQFMGDPYQGWARVLFDGVEVWRGDTAAIWSKHGRHGGYIEISGLAPGPHTLRAESLGFDYHPIQVASFGFSKQGGVAPQK